MPTDSRKDPGASLAIARAVTLITAARDDGADLPGVMVDTLDGTTKEEVLAVIMALARVAAVATKPEQLYSLATDVNLRLAEGDVT